MTTPKAPSPTCEGACAAREPRTWCHECLLKAYDRRGKLLERCADWLSDETKLRQDILAELEGS